ncbi:SGNH/GDSL hydrolase family protein [Pseudonocardia parietis]|uniref:Acyl-CoA thioesterase-1 n=1 Tax=Pseudonocardia parietis TaxID=570936 RepID=A0ABS4W4H5_9PSEU|nr:SGNH/GDSL hydrolase family protein [Pseudonocardia parietis]MBP2371101.1 acyl-CoA thioesterase-1 [Pseudonocardia parietis]
MDSDLMTRLIRFADLTAWPAFAAFGVQEEEIDRLLAATAGLDPSAVSGVRAELSGRVRAAAGALLTERPVAAGLHRMALRPGERVAVVGDSISADRLSWARLLAELVPMVEPEASVEVLALSGRTSSEALALGPVLVSRVPTRVLVLLGTNDVRREGATTGVRMVSATETARNLRALRLLLETDAGARVRFVVPPPVDPSRVGLSRELTGEWWDGGDLAELVAIVRDVDPEAIDLSRLPVRPGFWEDDGLHPSPLGQVAILRAVLAAI